MQNLAIDSENTPSTIAGKRINGLDPQALANTVEAIAIDPSRAAVSFSAKSAWQDGFRSHTDVESYQLGGELIPRQHRIATDEPLELFGANAAANPQELLLAALNSCLLVSIVAAATKRGVEIRTLGIESSLELDLRGAFGISPDVPPGASCIRYRLEVEAPTASPEQLREIHEEASANSPNRFHLSRALSIESELVIR